ncbi:MAG: hypothetical protein K2G24_02640 [Muribaculaceae bacterium]|nr:hypothetical protein [Muribaculaceae bacterium]
MRAGILLMLAVIAAGSIHGQRSWRGKRQAEPPALAQAATPMRACDSTMVSGSGFEKTLRSSIESVFLTNHTDDTVRKVCLDIEYLDTNGRQLHRRNEHFSVEIPPKSTRRLEFRSFDRQNVFYYHLSSRPRTRSNATPFKVRLRVDSI